MPTAQVAYVIRPSLPEVAEAWIFARNTRECIAVYLCRQDRMVRGKVSASNEEAANELLAMAATTWSA
jgi:hypothetical protein